MTESQHPYKGSCLCGGITFEVDAIEPQMGHCHCSMCRKFHGAAFSTYGEAKKENFRWTSGQALISDFVAINGTHRQFCGKCGSSLTFSPSENTQGIVEFSLGALDNDIEQRPNAHLFVGSKANWSALDDDLPKFKESRISKK